jgi:hypothetical protein
MKKGKPKKKVQVRKSSGATRTAKPAARYIGETEKKL